MTKQLNESRAMLDEVKSLETELRTHDGTGQSRRHHPNRFRPRTFLAFRALGGPSAADARALEQMLQSSPPRDLFEEIGREVRALRAEAEQRIASVQSIERSKYRPNVKCIKPPPTCGRCRAT
jgi:hypothetical protein